ncbi:MAG: hypothetical protein HQ517_07285 [SAR324 cluster bacterium]|nr:hypothetical protein [SAR324 cluster bacterium]
MTDRETGSTTYYKAIDQIMANTIPVALPVLAIGVYFDPRQGSKKMFSARFKIIDPNDNEVKVLVVSDIKKTSMRHRLNVRIVNMIFKTEGNYKIKIETSEDKGKNWKEMNHTVLPVTKIKSEDELEN